jgi:hypothetical protein
MPSLETTAQRIADAYQPPDTGRWSALSDANTLTELLTQLAAGQRRTVACQMAGITERTLYRWIEQADAGEEPQRTLVSAVKRAEAIAESRIVGNVIAASEKPQFWAAGMTYLERKYPEQWGRRSEDSSSPKVIVQIGVKDSDVQVSVSALEPTFACSTQALSPAQPLLIGDVASDNSKLR